MYAMQQLELPKKVFMTGGFMDSHVRYPLSSVKKFALLNFLATLSHFMKLELMQRI